MQVTPRLPTLDEARKHALSIYLELTEEDVEDIEVSEWDERTFEYGSEEYMVLTDVEAQNLAYDSMDDTLWAFNASFLYGYTLNNIEQEHIEKIQELYEDANPIIRALLGDDKERMFDDAIGCDGRGHFLNTYDGDEIEAGRFTTHEGFEDSQFEVHDLYIYRMN